MYIVNLNIINRIKSNCYVKMHDIRCFLLTDNLNDFYQMHCK